MSSAGSPLLSVVTDRDYSTSRNRPHPIEVNPDYAEPPVDVLFSPTWKQALNPTVNVPKGSVKSSVFALVSTIIGGGALSLPLAFAETGVLLGTIMLLFVATLSAYSASLLVSCGRRTQQNDYGGVAYVAFGIRMEMLVTFSVFCLTFLAGVAYLLLLADMTRPLVAQFTSLGGWYQTRPFLSGVCVVCVLPVCLLKSITSLRFTSALSVCAILILACGVVYRCVQLSFQQRGTDYIVAHLELATFKPTTLLSFALMSVSFLCHFNVLPVHSSLRKPTRERVKRVL
jgi:amino acid permease